MPERTYFTMKDKIYYLPVTLTSHNGGTGSHSYFAVQPVPREGQEPWPLTLSPDQMHLVYIHPSQLYTAPDEAADTLEELIAQRNNARIAAEFKREQSHD